LRKLLLQVFFLVLISAVLAVASNSWRSGGLPWEGSQPEALVHRDLDWLSVEAAAPLQEDVLTLFIDARPLEQFESRRIFGAVSLPADDLLAHWVMLRDFLDPSMNLVVYADDPNLTVRTTEFLLARGLRAQGLGGGWEAWSNARLPEERGR